MFRHDSSRNRSHSRHLYAAFMFPRSSQVGTEKLSGLTRSVLSSLQAKLKESEAALVSGFWTFLPTTGDPACLLTAPPPRPAPPRSLSGHMTAPYHLPKTGELKMKMRRSGPDRGWESMRRCSEAQAGLWNYISIFIKPKLK